MRIGLFTDTYYPEINGVANSVYTLFTQLTALGHDVHVFAPRCKGYEDHESDNVHYIKSVPLVVLKDRNLSLAGPRLAHKLKKYGFDIIHTHSEFAMGILAFYAAKILHCAHIHTYHTVWEDYVYYITHGVGDEQAKVFARKYSRFWCNRCEAVVAPTQKTVRLLESYGVRTPIYEVPSGLNIDRFAPEKHDQDMRERVREECGVKPGERVLLNLGRIAKEKNLEQVMRVFPSLLRQCPDVRFLIVGEGPAIEPLRQQAKTLGCENEVLFAGPKPWDVIDQYYAIGDVFASASHSETQGLTYIEAMAAGLCVVAYDDPCLEGVINHEENGLLFPDDDGALLEMLLRAFSDEGKTIAARAPQSVRRFTPIAFARAIVHVYEKSLEGLDGKD